MAPSQMATELSPLVAPIYTVAEASRLTKLSPGRIRRWLEGYEYSWKASEEPQLRHGSQSPVVRQRIAPELPYVSFLDLVDLLFIRALLDEGLSLQRIRKSLEEASAIRGFDKFRRDIYYTMNHHLFMRARMKGSPIRKLVSSGQLSMEPIINALGRQIEFDSVTTLANRWYPMFPKKIVVLDPLIAYGSPTLSGRRVTTGAVYELYRAEAEKIEPICGWFGINRIEASSAVEFEMKLAA